MTSDIVLESVQTAVLLGLVVFLYIAGRRRADLPRRGWALILLGFQLLLFASAIDITDDFEALNRFYVIGDTPVQAALEKIVGSLGGFIAVAVGLMLWMPAVAGAQRVEAIRAELREANRKLSQANGEIAVLTAKLQLQDQHGASAVGTDRDTGVLTRPAWKRSVSNHCPFEELGDIPSSIVIIEVDHLAELSRAAGSAAGDETLRRIADAIRSSCRRSDLIGHFGSGEFAVLARGMDLDGAMELAQRIRSHVSKAALPNPGVADDAVVTISIGLARAERSLDENWNSVIERASGALGTARAAGRNRICVAPPASAAA